ncbi:SURF1 family protein [Haloglycomyces albus]|uniref:SURF1 family protein n=1 Tax=Haloglycomyces albus TaxID=526067 RepID=UPI00146FB7EA|nr:SURF1 family protein [Haloglycomyces albus]
MAKQDRSSSSRRIVVLTIAAVIGIVVCALLSRWQWNRAVDRSEANHRVENTTEVVALDSILPQDGAPADDDRWKLVEVTGTYAERDMVVRLRSLEGSQGVEVVTPLELDDGTSVLVNRGFTTDADAAPPPPDGEVTVTGRLFESEPSGGEVSTEDGVLKSRRINTADLSEESGLELRSGYVGLTATAEGLEPIAAPTFKSWMNYSYAGQWALFALMIPLGWFVLVRKEKRRDTTKTSPSEVVDRDAFVNTAESSDKRAQV